MVEVLILCDIKTGYKKVKIERELNWYDPIRKELLEFKGGKLEYEYKEDPYLVKMGETERKKRGIKSTWRVVPKASPLEVVNYNKPFTETNRDFILKECKNYVNYNEDIFITDVNNSNIVVMIEDENVNDFCYYLERKGIRFNI